MDSTHCYFAGGTAVLVHNADYWKFGSFKSETKWANQMAKRGWTNQQITEAITSGKKFKAIYMVNKGNKAYRFIHPTTGRSVIQDAVTKEILQVGGDGFLW